MARRWSWAAHYCGHVRHKAYLPYTDAHKLPAPALVLCEPNARNYPASFIAHDSLGNYCLAKSQPKLAAVFAQVLQKQYPTIRKKLAQLRVKKEALRQPVAF